MALCTLQNVIDRIPSFESTVANLAILQFSLDAAENVVKRFCNRNFSLEVYDEVLDVAGSDKYGSILLSEYPVTKIIRVSGSLVPVIMIRNTRLTVSRASFRMEGDTAKPSKPKTLFLNFAEEGVTVEVGLNLQTGLADLNISGYPNWPGWWSFPELANSAGTFADLASVISQCSQGGNPVIQFGWTATALGSNVYGSWNISDLYPITPAYDVSRGSASYISHYAYHLNNYQVNNDIGEIVCHYAFGKGYRNLRVQYEAGFAVVPPAIQEAVAELAAATYLDRTRTGPYLSESLGQYSYQNFSNRTFEMLSLATRYGLATYKNYRVSKYKII